MAKKIPMRMCVGCRAMKEKRSLIRVVRTEGGEARLDPTGKLNGRGAYVCPSAECLKRAVKTRALDRALEVSISPEVMEKLAEEVERLTPAETEGDGA